MKKYFIPLIFLIACSNSNKKQDNVALFSNEEIESLDCKSTVVLATQIDSIEKIDLEPYLKSNSFDFGELIDSLYFVPLHTSNNSLVDKIQRILITEGRIIIQDSYKGGGVIIFNRDGQFIQRIPNGKGPGELHRLYDITIDNQNKELIVYQHSSLSFYSLSGKFIRQQKTLFGFINFTSIPDGYVFKMHGEEGNFHLKDKKDYLMLITDKNFKIKSSGLKKNNNKISLQGWNYFENNTQLYMSDRFNDTIYNFDNNYQKLNAKYTLNLGKNALPKHLLKKQDSDFFKEINKNDFFYFLGRWIDTPNHQVFFIENDYRKFRTVVFRDKASKHILGGMNANYNIEEIPPIAFPTTSYKNFLISSYLPTTIDQRLQSSVKISSQDKLRIKGLNENDNPILVFYKLKGF